MAPATNSTMKVVGICGSLRTRSTNAALLRYAATIAPQYGIQVTIADIKGIPLYNGDVEAVGLPTEVIALREAIRASDGVLFASPEYNYSVAGVLKNTIDWISRPEKDGKRPQPFAGKAGGVIGAGGFAGTAKSQVALRQVMYGLDVPMLMRPEVLVRLFDGTKRFDPATGDLVDETTQKVLHSFMIAYGAHVRRTTAGYQAEPLT